MTDGLILGAWALIVVNGAFSRRSSLFGCEMEQMVDSVEQRLKAKKLETI